MLVGDGGSQVSVDGARVAYELWAALLAATNAFPPPPPAQPAPILEAYVQAKVALAALGADQRAGGVTNEASVSSRCLDGHESSSQSLCCVE